VLVGLAAAFVTLAGGLLCTSHMKIHRLFTVLVAVVLVPFLLSWGTLLLIPAALLLVPCVLLAAIAALPALVVAATSPHHHAPRPQAPVSTTPIYST
jgi:predicted MFS family arabinose efflux permease